MPSKTRVDKGIRTFKIVCEKEKIETIKRAIEKAKSEGRKHGGMEMSDAYALDLICGDYLAQ